MSGYCLLPLCPSKIEAMLVLIGVTGLGCTLGVCPMAGRRVGVGVLNIGVKLNGMVEHVAGGVVAITGMVVVSERRVTSAANSEFRFLATCRVACKGISVINP